MKKIVVMLCLCVCAASVLSAQASRGGTMYVAVQNLTLKSGTGIFASSVNPQLPYGTQVSVLQVNGAWVQVRSTSPSATGWAKTASLSARRVLAGSGTSASAQEVALAGKGFNEEVENAYRAEGSLNYADVDRMEAQQVNMQELEAFLREGRLAMGE